MGSPSIHRVHHQPDGQLVPAAGDRLLLTTAIFALSGRRGLLVRSCLSAFITSIISTVVVSDSEARVNVGIILVTVIIRADDDGEIIVCEAIRGGGDVRQQKAAASEGMFVNRLLLYYPSITGIHRSIEVSPPLLSLP